MDAPSEDPLLRSARREALISLIVFVAALLYTISYCSAYGTQPEPRLILGIPSWVVWGVFLPWAVCLLFQCWFSMVVMQDHELEEPAPPPDAEGVTQEDAPPSPN